MSRTLNNAFPIVAAALGNRLGVKVRVGGQDARTDGDLIQVPAYDGDDPDYRAVAWGYLAHEAAHVRYTAFEYFRQAAAQPIRKALLNILEDVRIEKQLAECYPGTRLTIEKTVERLVATGRYVPPEPEDAPAAVLQSFLLFRLRSRELRQTALAGLADRAERQLDERFPPGAVTRLHGLLTEVPQLAETRDCLRLADRILRMIQDEIEQVRERVGRSEPPEKLGDSSGTDGQDSNPISHHGDPLIGGDPGKPGEGVFALPVDDAMADEETVRVLQATLGAGDDDLRPDLFDLAREGLRLTAASNRETVLPVPDEPPLDRLRGAALVDRSATESGKLRATLQGLVQSSRLRKPWHRRAGNRLDGRRLSRIAIGDPRVFVRPAPQRSPHTAIHLLVDRSPSMNAPVMEAGVLIGTRIELAWEASIALALALEGIAGVNPAVTAFPGRLGESGSVFRVMDHGHRVRQRAGYFGFGTEGNTPLAEALWYAASRLLACREPRKIILALTDGEPNEVDAARDILARCEASGIEVVGIGLGIEVGSLFSRAISIRRIAELRSRLFELSRDLLIAA